jgi:hypothetical protein
MGTPIFDKLAKTDRDRIIAELHEYQEKKCYICGERVELTEPLDVDHIRSRDRGGIDSRNNWGLTHAHCNRSKSNKDLDLQRYLVRFQRARKEHLASGKGEDSFTVGVALNLHDGGKRDLVGRIERLQDGDEVFVTTIETSDGTRTLRFPIECDLNNPSIKSFTALVPIEYVFHDSDINPRSIVDLENFIEEFYRGNPQLLPSLAHFSIEQNSSKGRVMLFDGQHKAAAQLFLGNRRLYIRVFLNADLKVLKTTNFGAHTKLAQIHFPMAIQDKVGHDIFRPALENYLNAYPERASIKEDSYFHTLAKEERSAMRAHFQGYLKFRVMSTAGAENGHFFDYVETVSARSKTKPLAYETVRKAIFNNFLCLYETNTPIDLALKMRDIERDNLAKLLKLFTEKVLENQFVLTKGIYKIEENLASDPAIRDPHLRAYRLCRQAPLIVTMRELREALSQLLSLRGRYHDPAWHHEQVLWSDIRKEDWAAVAKMLDVVVSHKVWIERLSKTVLTLQDTRQKSWEDILIRGVLPGASQPVYEPLNQAVLLKHASVV